MRQREPRFLRVLGFAFATFYVAFVGILALLKVTMPAVIPVTWSEVIYGPALSVVSSYALITVGIWIEDRIRIERARRSEQREGKR
jgi:hypothetical protein